MPRAPLAPAIVLLVACAGPGPGPGWDLAAPLDREHVFAPVIAAWQAAQRLEDLPPLSVPEPDAELVGELAAFERELRGVIVDRVLAWVRAQGHVRFRDDSDVDRWPTFGEMLHRGSDDCDGLELLEFRLLRRAGFARGEIYRAVLAGPADQHHMVTLWFADGPGTDPLVLDPLHRAVYRPTPLSRLHRWRPVVLFDEHEAFAARPRR